MPKSSGIYLIKNAITGSLYVGSSKNIRTRVDVHKFNLRRGTHHSPYLQRSWDKYGEDAFLFSVVELCDLTLLIEREQFYFGVMKPDYNVLKTAGSRLGSKQSPETRAKISAANKGKPKPPRTAEHQAKITEATQNRSEKTREKMAAAKRGTKASDETRIKMSEAARGKAKDPDAIARMVRTKAEKRLEKISKIDEQRHDAVLIKNDVRHMLRALSDDQVREIRTSTKTSRELGLLFGVSDTTVNRIRRGVIYKDIF